MLELKKIYKDYYVDKKPFHALKNINLYFPKTEFCSILGPSGSGKTTTLNIIGGLDKYTSDDLLIEGQSTKKFGDKEWDNYRNKKIGFVFQSYNLIPQLNLADNVSMGLTLNGESRKSRLEKARKALDSVGLKGLYNKRPNQLSGGQMQRVAIARAIVHNPEIILADEPTGALDSVTSLQIMDILKEISKTHLVIMVTHNRELAVKYSDRIIEFKDGEVEKDSDIDKIASIKEKEDAIYKKEREDKLQELTLIDEKDKKTKHKIKEEKRREKLSHMSFFNAFKLSLKNLLTKKGRTIMTSIAGSFGIIGVALVLAVNNGFGNYITRMEEETASQMPLTVSSYTITYEKNDDYIENPAYSDETVVYPYQSSTGGQKMTYNDISEKYVNYLNKIKDTTDYMNDYVISYGDTYDFHLMGKNSDGEVINIENKTYTNTMISMVSSLTGLPNTYFHVLYGQEKYILSNYDLIAGTYPKEDAKDELVLLVDSRNQISLSILKALGFYKNDDSVDVDYAQKHPIDFNDIVNREYKVFSNDEYYDQSSLSTSDKATINYYKAKDKDKLFNGDTGLKLKISGILRPKENSTMTSMNTGLCYLNSMQNYLVKENESSKINNTIKNNVRWKDNMSTTEFINSLRGLVNGESSSVSINSINSLFNTYLDFYNVYNGQTKNSAGKNYGFSDYLKWANNIGANLIDDELKKNGTSLMLDYIEKIVGYVLIGGEKKNEALSYAISLLAYINSYSNIQNIIIFPSSLTNKTKLIELLDKYNEIDETQTSVDHAWKASEQVHYTDLVGTLTGSLSQLIDIISIVLIVFASISLVVSSVMTGIITFVSVVERTKEIGVLRALGARKKDVGRLFEAECVVIGFFSGGIGCFVAYIATFPINMIINKVYPEYNIGNIASLSFTSVLVLIIISVGLAFLSSLFPARAAANKDPVVALRTE